MRRAFLVVNRAAMFEAPVPSQTSWRASVAASARCRAQRIAEPLVAITRHQRDTIGLERIERVSEFAGIGIGERQHGKIAESSRRVGNHLGGILIRFAAEPPRRIALGELTTCVVTDSIEAAMPALSIPSSDFSIVQFFIRGSPGRHRSTRPHRSAATDVMDVNSERLCAGGLCRGPLAAGRRR